MHKDNLLTLLNKWTVLKPKDGQRLEDVLAEFHMSKLGIPELLIMEAMKHILTELEELKKK